MPIERIHIPENEAEFIRQSIAAGRYNNESEVVVAALQVLRELAAYDEARIEHLRAELKKGFDDFENGRYVVLRNREDIRAHGEEMMRRATEALERESGDDSSASSQ